MVVLSIITINYNNHEGLKKTFDSVFRQNSKAFEYIVIDGGSTDGSKQIIEANTDRIDFWVSERDRGIYHAMNKGVLQASGKYIWMMNSGDCLADENVVQNCINAISSSDEDLLCFNFFWKTSNGLIEHNGYQEFTYRFFRQGSIGHQSTLIKRTLHDRAGLYDERLKIASDWKFFVLSICKYNASYKLCGSKISICDQDGISWNKEFQEKIQEEKRSVYKEYFPAFESDYQLFDRKEDYYNTINRNLFIRVLKKMRLLQSTRPV